MIPRAEHPRPDFMRSDWLTLNGAWSFDFEEQGMSCATELKRSIQVPFSWTAPLSGIHEDKKGVAWYARTVHFTPQRQSDHVWLCFMAVDYTCDVYVNGQLVGSHTGGYDPFALDVSKYWKAEDNLLCVRAMDNDCEDQPRGKQSYGEARGIWQSVYLEARPEHYIKEFTIKTTIQGQIEAKVVADGEGEVALDFGEGARGGACFSIEKPHLWSCDDPYLYEGTIAWGEDVVTTYFGIREVGASIFGKQKTKWITLNGEPVYLNGTLDQSFNPQGYFTLPSEQEIIDEVMRLKSIGINLLRIHIKPEEPRKLYWLDKLGVMVMADMACIWGDPTQEACVQYEKELMAFVQRDINHPSIIAWVVFNETWGLFTNLQGGRIFTQNTQEWVLRLYEQVKAYDPTRLVEDNSPCNYDHVKTDINSWHFYINGYRAVKDHIMDMVKHTYVGSKHNYIGGRVQDDAPLMNSECGMVWGVDGSAGESDLAWQYHYMLNEYRLHDPICGFVFTEFHDVVNEFNGYYRINNVVKDFGYQAFCEGMSIKDLHAMDFVAYDAPPCQTVACGQEVSIPLVHSNFSSSTHKKPMYLRWRLWHEGMHWKKETQSGGMRFLCTGYGANSIGDLQVTMPHADAVAILSWQLECDGKVLSRNFTTFDVRGEKEQVSVKPNQYQAKKWDLDWSALSGHKVCGAGKGYYAYTIDVEPLFDEEIPSALEIFFEASAKRVLKKDAMQSKQYQVPDNLFTQAYNIDPGENPNSYFMSDTSSFPSEIEVWANGTKIHAEVLPNDPADSRGVLSWHYQPRDRVLDEAGSYGYLVKAQIPPALLGKIAQADFVLKLEIRAVGSGGLAIYGRNAGRFPIDIVVDEVW